MKEYEWECLACGDLVLTSQEKEPEECHGCGEHKPERFEFKGVQNEDSAMSYWWNRCQEAEEELLKASKRLNSVNFELSSGTYTIEADEFEKVFLTRDLIDLYLKKRNK